VPEPTSLSAADHTSIDPLTQALDRRAFANWCDLFWNAASGPTVDFALLFIDFDNFKEVNDKYGHVIGDKVLAELVLALKGAIRDGDQLYRYGGDEFVLVAHGIRDTQSLARIVRRVSAAADTTVELPGTRVAVRASVGGAMSGEGFASIDDMLSAADRRMYESKHHPG
jgi:diguanylate cyclase (GGDEF)-like protein